MDTDQFAADIGVSAKDASSYLALRPLIGELRELLEVEAKGEFSDLYLAYNPFRVVVLSLGTGDVERSALLKAEHFKELVGVVEYRHVNYTEKSLMQGMEEVGALAGTSGQASEADMRTGTVRIWVTSPEAADSLVSAIQEAEATGELSVPAASVEVLVGGGTVTLDSFAGNALNRQNGAAECTSGFSVQQTGGGTLEGVSTAGHCFNTLELSNGDDIVFQAQRYQNDQDVQWHTTPSHTDQPWMRDGPSSVRNVTSRTSRTSMNIGDPVCKYGRTTGYTCGLIELKNFDPDTGSTFNATFIRVDDGNDTLALGGDSGGPWYFGTSAYGLTHGAPLDDLTDAIFMAQNYMSVLNIRVKIL